MSKESNTIYEKLLYIQQNLKAHKGQFNSFGKYHYRSLEDIQEALKPCLDEVGCVFIITDELVVVGDRYYIKATATLIDTKTGDKVSNTGFAREEESKRGMDGSQITGTASSYARKYAANGLFAIDDTKDADTDGYKQQQNNAPSEEVICPKCSKPVAPGKGRSGKIAQPKEVLAKLGMCADCYREQQDKAS